MPKLQITTDDFKEHRETGAYLIDKSLFIHDVLEGNKALLLPRPRRFGKTFNLSMLRYFFELSDESQTYLFDDLHIADHPSAMKHQGRYPTIFLSLKDIGGPDWATAYSDIVKEISELYRHFDYLRDHLKPEERDSFDALCLRDGDLPTTKHSLKDLVTHLYRYHNRPVVVLIDEYDSPVIEAYDNDYYDTMIDFMRAWLGGGLKHQHGGAIFRAVVSGVLRIARESIFSGLNNLDVQTILNPGPFADKFGFTETEVRRALDDFGLSNTFDDVHQWYDGYTFGNNTIYNPWSVLKFINDHPLPVGPHWLNTSANILVHEELKAGGLELKQDLETLLADQTLRYPINENIVFSDVQKNRENIWSFLTFSGYLRASNPHRNPITDSLTYELSIPNREVREVYKRFVQNWYDELDFGQTEELLQALIGEDYRRFEQLLADLIKGLFSYHDTARFPEAAYHAFALGLLANLRAIYNVHSNTESGYGRADILLEPTTDDYPLGFVIEFKSIESDQNPAEHVQLAFDQAIQQGYDTKLREAGVNPEDIRHLAIIVAGKQVSVKCREA